MRVLLRGYPEAVAAADRIDIAATGPVTAQWIADAVATRIGDPAVRATLFVPDGDLRATTRVLDAGGQTVPPGGTVTGQESVTLLAVLPCDG